MPRQRHRPLGRPFARRGLGGKQLYQMFQQAFDVLFPNWKQDFIALLEKSDEFNMLVEFVNRDEEVSEFNLENVAEACYKSAKVVSTQIRKTNKLALEHIVPLTPSSVFNILMWIRPIPEKENFAQHMMLQLNKFFMAHSFRIFSLVVSSNLEDAQYMIRYYIEKLTQLVGEVNRDLWKVLVNRIDGMKMLIGDKNMHMLGEDLSGRMKNLFRGRRPFREILSIDSTPMQGSSSPIASVELPTVELIAPPNVVHQPLDIDFGDDGGELEDGFDMHQINFDIEESDEEEQMQVETVNRDIVERAEMSRSQSIAQVEPLDSLEGDELSNMFSPAETNLSIAEGTPAEGASIRSNFDFSQPSSDVFVEEFPNARNLLDLYDEVYNFILKSENRALILERISTLNAIIARYYVGGIYNLRSLRFDLADSTYRSAVSQIERLRVRMLKLDIPTSVIAPVARELAGHEDPSDGTYGE